MKQQEEEEWLDLLLSTSDDDGKPSKEAEPRPMTSAVPRATFQKKDASARLVATRHNISREEFLSDFHNQRPLVVLGLAERWPAMRLWTPAYLAQKVGSASTLASSPKDVPPLKEDGPVTPAEVVQGKEEEKLRVFRAKDNLTFLDDEQVVEIVQMTFTEVLQHVFGKKKEEADEECFNGEANNDEPLNSFKERNTTTKGRRLYLRAPLFQQIRQDIEWPFHLLPGHQRPTEQQETEKDKVVFSEALSGLWVGHSGNITPLHYDLFHGFLVQVRGRKHVCMFSPDDTGFLQPNNTATSAATTKKKAHVGQLNLCRYDRRDEEERRLFPSVPEAQRCLFFSFCSFLLFFLCCLVFSLSSFFLLSVIFFLFQFCLQNLCQHLLQR
ncbi:tunicamycin resistance protein, variant 2 [Balamuthia mandrillaris]